MKKSSWKQPNSHFACTGTKKKNKPHTKKRNRYYLHIKILQLLVSHTHWKFHFLCLSSIRAANNGKGWRLWDVVFLPRTPRRLGAGAAATLLHTGTWKGAPHPVTRRWHGPVPVPLPHSGPGAGRQAAGQPETGRPRREVSGLLLALVGGGPQATRRRPPPPPARFAAGRAASAGPGFPGQGGWRAAAGAAPLRPGLGGER